MALDYPPGPPIALDGLHEAHMFGLGPTADCLADLGGLGHSTVAFTLVTCRKSHQFLRLSKISKWLLGLERRFKLIRTFSKLDAVLVVLFKLST